MNLRNALVKDIHFYPVAGGHPFACIEVPQLNQVHFSISVRAGHFYDPEDIQGLAHLLEHMLFLGSRQHPEPNQLIHHIQHLGGTVNAWTSGEFANYHFSCPCPHFDDIAVAFIGSLFHPLFKETVIDKEIDSIDAEFRFKQKDELRRLYQIHKETCNPNHPFSKFSVGNAELFGQVGSSQLRAQLKRFHKTYYTKENIRIAISAPELSPSSVKLITHALECLPQGIPSPCAWPNLYRPQDLKIQINVKPLQEARRLIITFAIQTAIKPLENALHYISHILGDESSGSLLAYLRMEGWATNLVAGSGIEGERFKDFNLNIQLTDQGEQKICAIFGALFYTLSLIAREDEAWRREEKAQLDNLALNHNESPPSLDRVCEFAESLFSGVDKFDRQACSAEELSQALAWMTPDNLRIKLISPNVVTDKSCLYYFAQYAVAEIDQVVLTQCCTPSEVAYIHLPKRNVFLNQAPKLLTRNKQWAQLSDVSRDNKKVWFRQDQVFNSIKGDLFSSFDLPHLSDDSHAKATKRIWLQAVNTHLQESLYHAAIAGLHYRVYGHQCGFSLHCKGFTNGLINLAQQVLTRSMQLNVTPEMFQYCRQTQLKTLKNRLLNKPINRLLSNLGVVLQKHSIPSAMLIDSMNSMTYDTFTTTLQNGFQAPFCESMLNGNWTLDHAMQWSNTLDELGLNYTSSAVSRAVLKLACKKLWVRKIDCEHDDAAIVLYIQAPSANAKYTAFCMLLEQLLAGPYFNALRTEQQLGYVVGTGFAPYNQHPGIVFYIQSPSHSASYLFDNMLSFLREQVHNLVFYKNYWPSMRQNLLKQVSEKDANLSMQSQRLWLSLANVDTGQQQKQHLVNAIQQFSFEELVAIAQTIVDRGVFGELLLYAQGKHPPFSDDVGTGIGDLSAFKSQANFFH